MTTFAAIHFFVDGREYAYRSWSFIPRVGDEVMLGEGDRRKAYVVKRVVWGNDAPDASRHEPQRINIELELASPEPAHG